jgi:hypothetical protein
MKEKGEEMNVPACRRFLDAAAAPSLSQDRLRQRAGFGTGPGGASS